MEDPFYPPPFDFSSLPTYPLKDRPSKVSARQAGHPHSAGDSFREWLASLPDHLAAGDLKLLANSVVEARKKDRPVLWGLGGHVIKVGLGPVMLDLMARGMVSGLVLNGAAAIHDLELAIAGKTSEVVEESLLSGTFGLAKETGGVFFEALAAGIPNGWGLGKSLSHHLAGVDPPHADVSLLVGAHRHRIPVTVHVAIGTDIVHIHPSADGKLLGEGSLRDLGTLCSLVSQLAGGVYLNVGSAVVLPEVFLKAVSAACGSGFSLRGMVTANLDFIQHYRPHQNVLNRPTAEGGKGIALTGHHEIMVPLLAAAIIELSESPDVGR